MTVFDVRIEIEDVSQFEKIDEALRKAFKGKKVYEISCQNVD